MSRSSCLRQRCSMYTGRNCDSCSCVECRNTEENAYEVAEERDKILSKNPHAFQDKRVRRYIAAGQSTVLVLLTSGDRRSTAQMN